jgi:hypothetical protein
MTIAFVCPDSFTDYEAMEKELLKYKDISKIICATTNASNLVEDFCLDNSIKLWLVKDGGKLKRLRTMVERADKIILFEFTDYDGVKYSRTQYAMKYAQKLEKNLDIVNYDRKQEAQNQLNRLYNKYFIEKIDESNILSKLSTPFLISIPENYFIGKKILFVGQDTFGWYGTYQEEFSKAPNPVEYATNCHKQFFDNLEKSTAIWKFYKELVNSSKVPIIPNNIYKCDYIEGYGKWYTASHMLTQQGHTNKLKQLIDLQKDIFCKELEILKPDLVFLMISHNNDKLPFKYCFEDGLKFEQVLNGLDEKWLGKLSGEYENFPKETYRTYHPGHLLRNQNKLSQILKFFKEKLSDDPI